MGGMPRIILTAAKSQQPAATSQDLLDCVIKSLKGARKARAARRRALLPRRTSVHCFLMGLAVALVALASVGISADAAKTRSSRNRIATASAEDSCLAGLLLRRIFLGGGRENFLCSSATVAT